MRTEELTDMARERGLDRIIVMNQANIRALTGINCDNAVLQADLAGSRTSVTFYTDFRYVPMVHRVAPELRCVDIARFGKGGAKNVRKIGFEATIPHQRYCRLEKLFPKAELVDVAEATAALRMVKTPDEIAALREAERLNCSIWNEAKERFAAGMTEREMARIIQVMMIERGEGEAFDTIVCVGKNAAECHHEPDDTVWNGREPVLVDMGVKVNGFCSDLTRNIVPARPSRLYRKVYDLVLKANEAAIAAARPGMTGKALDRVARDVIDAGGFAKCFGHSLGHGVGLEIHEGPSASCRSKTVLKPGMAVTIEPGVYLEDNLGVRIEDLVLITDTGCEVLSSSAAK